ncbi:shikimate dehydrogenase [Lentibacillus sp. N15]|uniref:shikimate dehydrogenase n=1 Tax=Lentibacillus songyuanensis TaxID=3136161 RepID=UPI0031BA74C0
MEFTFALIGYPVQHSLSPWIHQQFLKRTGLNGSYSIEEITPNESFDERMADLRRQNLDGFNVTVPYKQTIIPYLDDIHDDAKRIGAVNTVVNRDGKWIGYNTDGKGYVRSLQKHYPKLCMDKDIKIVIIGSGGAARGIYDALVTEGFRFIDIANRTISSAEAIAQLQQEQSHTTILPLADLEAKITRYDLIIQTTSVGMKPHQEQSIIPADVSFKAGSVVSDIIYQPIKTNVLKQAGKQGALVHYGHVMLLYQAQYAFELWTDHHFSIEDMEEQLQQILEGR